MEPSSPPKPPTTMQAHQRAAESRAGEGLLAGAGQALAILMRSSLFKKLTVCSLMFAVGAGAMFGVAGGWRRSQTVMPLRLAPTLPPMLLSCCPPPGVHDADGGSI